MSKLQSLEAEAGVYLGNVGRFGVLIVFRAS